MYKSLILPSTKKELKIHDDGAVWPTNLVAIQLGRSVYIEIN